MRWNTAIPRSLRLRQVWEQQVHESKATAFADLVILLMDKAPSKLCFWVVLFCDTVTNQQRNPEGRGRSPNGKKLPLGVNHDRLWWYCWWLPPKKIPFALLSLRNSSVSLNPNWETYETTKRRLRKKNINHVDLLRTISQIHLHVPVIVSQ